MTQWKVIINKQIFVVSLSPHELMESIADVVGNKINTNRESIL